MQLIDKHEGCSKSLVEFILHLLSPHTQHQVASYLSSSRGGRGGPDKVMMNGPGGVGQSEVAVRAVPAAQVSQSIHMNVSAHRSVC